MKYNARKFATCGWMPNFTRRLGVFGITSPYSSVNILPFLGGRRCLGDPAYKPVILSFYPQFYSLSWFSHLNLILYGRKPKFLSSVALLPVSSFLSAISLFVFCHLVCRNSSLYLCVFVRCNKDDFFSPCHRIEDISHYLPPSTHSNLEFQILSLTYVNVHDTQAVSI